MGCTDRTSLYNAKAMMRLLVGRVIHLPLVQVEHFLIGIDATGLQIKFYYYCSAFGRLHASIWWLSLPTVLHFPLVVLLDHRQRRLRKNPRMVLDHYKVER